MFYAVLADREEPLLHSRVPCQLQWKANVLDPEPM
jgi:hypothetical protein